MRTILLAAFTVLLPASALAAADPAVPLGKLPDAARPTAYRIDLTVLPDQPRFSGHVEIDVTLKAPTRSLYLHGRDLKVSKAVARAGTSSVAARYSQVDPLGVVRLDFARELPAGPATLVFDYDAPFGDGPAGLYRVKVGDDWYAWSQFESIDARAAFPSFDQPGYKTPFTVTLTTRPGLKTVSNAAEAGATRAGALEKHRFQPTEPLPTYLVAFVVGPFATAEGSVPPTPQRAAPMPLRVVATKGQADKLAFALEESPRIVELLERYFDRPFPFPKLDQIASPIMPGAMENAGADIYEDNIILLDRGATTRQKQLFGMVVAHELSHQWFGDLVTPEWWDDIWLNESFANWMGYRIGNEWRPDLNIGVGAIDEALSAMNIDSLKAGRPIRQPIENSGEIDSAFDQVTYGKGGQVVAMIAAYMGDEKFREGVRLHISRHLYGNANSTDFFTALADAAHDPRVLAAMRSFVDQQGVPVVAIRREGGGLRVTQRRYAMLGTDAPAETWTIPLCIRNGATRTCTLLDQPSATIAAPGDGPIMPNAGGTGYYRFTLSDADWDALLATAPRLPAGEALAASDSLWASFRAGEMPVAKLIDAARRMADNPDSNVAVDGGQRLAGMRSRGMIAEGAIPAYRKLMDGIYQPKLAALRFDPRAGAHAGDAPDRQKLRQDLVALVAGEAHDPAVRGTLASAARAYLAGDRKALDQAFLRTALEIHVADGGLPAARALMAKMLDTQDGVFRSAALAALGGGGDPQVGRWLLGTLDNPKLRSTDRTTLLQALMIEPTTRDMAFDWLKANFDRLASDAGLFAVLGLMNMPARFCSVEKAREIETVLRPKAETYQRGVLALDRTVELVHDCGVLEEAKGKEIADAFTASR